MMMKQRFATTVLVSCLACAASAARAAPMEVESYPVRAPQAQLLRETVEALLGPDGKVIVDESTGRMIVVAPAEQQERIRQALDRIDLSAPNIRVRVSIQESRTDDSGEVGIRGSGGITVTPGGSGYHIKVAPRVQQHSMSGSSSIRQELLLQSGSTARLFVGQEVPVLEWIFEYARLYGYIEQRVTMRPVGASLAVTARVLGDDGTIHLRLTPEISAVVDGTRQRIAITRAETEVAVADGASREIAGFGEHKNLYDHYLAGIANSRSSASMRMVLTATVE